MMFLLRKKIILTNGIVADLKSGRNKPQTEGERIVEEFFIDSEIKYFKQVELYNLKDGRNSRRADFYLPSYKCFVEFLGDWEKYGEQQDYREKMGVYVKNDIRCVYLWKDNLGILKYIFHFRLIDTLKGVDKNGKKIKENWHEMKWELFKYKLHRFQRHFGKVFSYYIVLPVLISYSLLNLETGIANDFAGLIVMICGIFIILGILEIISAIKNHFIDDAKTISNIE